MKGALILVIVLILSFSLISAYYACSEGTINENSRELDIGNSKNINGIYLGLARSDETAVINRMNVELFFDSVSVTLTDNSPVIIEFMGEKEYNISLVNSTDNYARINVDGDEELIDEEEINQVGGFEVFLTSSEGNYPGTASVKVMIGKSRFPLSNLDEQSKIVTFEGRDYGVELFSASDQDALIKVSKCSNISTELIWTEDEVENITVNDTGEQNETINETGNETNGTENILNESSNESELNGTGNDGVVGENQEKSVIPNFVFYIIIGIITIIIFLLIARYVKGKTVPDNGQDEG